MPDNNISLDVSIIVPVLNDEKGVRHCLAALERQTFPLAKFEVIIVDNGSCPPLSIKMDCPFPAKIVNCEKQGSYAARNEGFIHATGGVIAFLDVDCIPDKDWIRRGVEALNRADQKSLVGGKVEVSKPSRRSGVALYQYSTGFFQRQNIEHKGFSVTANVFCTADQFKTIGPFEERLLSGGDREWFWRAAQVGIGVLYEPRAKVVTSPRSTLRSAIRQARRTAAGRFYLQKNNLDHLGPKAVQPHRSMWESFIWLLSRREFSLTERFKMLFAAIVIKLTTIVEKIRLRLGGRPERR